jgi:hypothetical protein
MCFISKIGVFIVSPRDFIVSTFKKKHYWYLFGFILKFYGFKAEKVIQLKFCPGSFQSDEKSCVFGRFAKFPSQKTVKLKQSAVTIYR